MSLNNTYPLFVCNKYLKRTSFKVNKETDSGKWNHLFLSNEVKQINIIISAKR